jgi:hypothetical protein
MKGFHLTLLITVVFTLLVLQSCDDDLKVRPFKVLELISAEPQAVYFFIIAENLSVYIDIAPTIPRNEMNFPKILPGESLLFETNNIDGYNVNESLSLFAYIDKTIEEDGITQDVISFEFKMDISADFIKNNAGRIIIRKPDYIQPD